MPELQRVSAWVWWGFIAVLITGFIFFTATRETTENPAWPEIEAPAAGRKLIPTVIEKEELSPPDIPSPPVPTARIEAVVYSHTKNAWAMYHPLGSGSYPNIRRLGFYTGGLTWLGAGIEWEGGHRITQDSIILSIKELSMPDEIECRLAEQFNLANHWSDVSVGYYIELRHATFSDHRLSKHVFVLRSFMRDSPPPYVEKSEPVVPVFGRLSTAQKIDGEWVGSYSDGDKTIPFMMRIWHDGDFIAGTAMDYDVNERRRSTLYG